MSIPNQIVKILEKNPNRFVSRADVVREVWGESKPLDKYTEGTLRVHISVAKDIALASDNEILIVTGRQTKGYLLKTD